MPASTAILENSRQTSAFRLKWPARVSNPDTTILGPPANSMSRTALDNSNADGEWWKKTTVYHIYVRSFYDSNGDGIGDIRGIIEKLDYLHDLGYETIWVSPFTQSPQKDFGYDISDYLSISPEYGDMPLFEKLVEEV